MDLEIPEPSIFTVNAVMVGHLHIIDSSLNTGHILSTLLTVTFILQKYIVIVTLTVH